MDINSLKNSFNTGFNNLIDSLGKIIKIQNGKIDCPNCIYDKVLKKSSGVYDTSNSYGVGSEYNKPFSNGQQCPVCQGVGTITQWSTITGLVNWKPRQRYENGALITTNRCCEIKIKKAYYNYILKSNEFLVPIDDSYVKCKKMIEPTSFGLGSHEFIIFVVEAIT
jgi:hypothetical protein